jgi:hypothetical protein
VIARQGAGRLGPGAASHIRQPEYRPRFAPWAKPRPGRPTTWRGHLTVVTALWRHGDHRKHLRTGDRAMRSGRFIGHSVWPANRSGPRSGACVGFTQTPGSPVRAPGRGRGRGRGHDGGIQQNRLNPQGTSPVSVPPDRRPPLSTDSRVAAGCGLFAQAERQNGTCPLKASRFRNGLIFAMPATRRSRHAKIF